MGYNGSRQYVEDIRIDYGDNTFNDKLTTNVEDSPSSSLEELLKKDHVQITKDKNAAVEILWGKVIYYGLLHIAAVYGAYLVFTSAMWQSSVFALFLYFVSNVGWTAGPHRLWSHRSYKATLPLRILLAFMFTLTFQRDILTWCRDHRLHHKYSDTDADPHNSKRGFFFSHIGWQMCRKHPDVLKKAKSFDYSDLLADPVVKYHRRYYYYWVLLCCVIIPTIIPMHYWNETFISSLFVCVALRLCLAYHGTFLVNSAAHMWGYRPYNVRIHPRENILVSLSATGEGFHNYHHTFPFDYAASEFGIKYNLATMFIDLMAWLGLAYDRKKANSKTIRACKLKKGEGSLKFREEWDVRPVKDEQNSEGWDGKPVKDNYEEWVVKPAEDEQNFD